MRRLGAAWGTRIDEVSVYGRRLSGNRFRISPILTTLGPFIPAA